jgi:hypothetical protein
MNQRSASCLDVDVVRNPPSVDWGEYFARIKTQCPWSYAAWQKGLIDVVQWEGDVLPLHPFSARVYLVDASDTEVELLADALDHGEYEWLFSYPGYGDFATPVTVLIQQDRATLARLRTKAET